MENTQEIKKQTPKKTVTTAVEVEPAYVRALNSYLLTKGKYECVSGQKVLATSLTREEAFKCANQFNIKHKLNVSVIKEIF